MSENNDRLVLFVYVNPNSDGKVIALGAVAKYKGQTKNYVLPFKASTNTGKSCLEKAAKIFTSINKVGDDFCIVQNVDASLKRIDGYKCYFLQSEKSQKVVPEMLQAKQLSEECKNYGATIQ